MSALHQLGFFGMQGPGGGGAVAAGVNKALQTVSVFVFADLLFCDEAAMAAGGEAIRMSPLFTLCNCSGAKVTHGPQLVRSIRFSAVPSREKQVSYNIVGS
jgi:hypothetical protein